jgi:hypothetical protein
MHPKGRASVIDRNAGRRRNTSCQIMPHSTTLSRYPRSRSSSRARRGLVVSTPTPCLSMTEIKTPKSSL